MKKPKPIDRYYDAKKRAVEGEPLTDEHARKRMARLGHWAGRKSIERVDRANAPLMEHKRQELDGAIESSKGVNRQALNLLKSAAAIPNQSSTFPDWGIHSYVRGDRENTTVVSWNNAFVFGEPADPSRPNLTPLVGDKPTLIVDSTDWSHAALRIPVDNVHLTVESPVQADGSQGAAALNVYVNSREYKPGELSDSDNYNGKVGFSFDSEGNLTKIGVGQENWSGFPDMDASKAHINTGEFLTQLQQAVDQTVAAYSQIESL